MKILKANDGMLTNFEVLDFLRSRGAAKDPTRVIAPIAASEWKVYDYLEQSVACNQTRETIKEFSEKCKKYNLATAEFINIINIRPSSVVEIDPIIEECDMVWENVLKSW
uniref:DNA-directed RNA polymerase III subunit RPC9 n=1 Tax=Davidia involucrata TaxID=16924 RepID=A0A5B6YPA6_DAVIN